ncbi:MAG: leucine-rich repeat domain-containing protein [Bacteroidales bacterium]
MKRKLFILLISILGISSYASAYDFSSIINGQTLYFNITSNTSPYTVEITSEIAIDPFFTTRPIGAVTIPDTISYNGNMYYVTSIGKNAFNECIGLISITLPNSILSIGDSAFYYCYSLTSPTIPPNLDSIGHAAFCNCESFITINLPNTITSIGDVAFRLCKDLSSINIPNSLTSIGNYTFHSCYDLLSINIPNTITSIGDYAFYYCESLTSINIPQTVTSIGEFAFGYCSEISTANIPIAFTKIPNGIYYNCISLTSINIPNSVTLIGEDAFWDCISLQTVTIPNSVDTIEGYAFGGCHSFTSITIPNSVKYIGRNAFSACYDATTISIPNSIKIINKSTFSGCSSLISITIPNSVTSIGESAFSGCINLSTVNLSDSLTSIGIGAFLQCYALTSITLPSSLESLSSNTFTWTGLTYIISEATNPPDISSYSFHDVPRTIPVFVPYSSLQSYQTAQYWSEFTNYHSIGSHQIIHTSFCEGDTFTNYGANIDSAGTYFLIYNNDSILLTLLVSPTYSETISATICQGDSYTLNGFNQSTAGTHVLNLQSINGCDSIITLNLIVNEVQTPTNLSLQRNQNHFELSWQSDADNFSIYRNNVLVFSTTNTVFIDTNVIDGTNYCYKVRAFDEDCEAESIEICQVFTGLNDIIDNPIQITLYPNPTSSSSRLEIDNVKGKVEITITDISGRVIQRMSTRANNKFETNLDLRNQSKGIYFINIITEKTKRTEKLVLK